MSFSYRNLSCSLACATFLGLSGAAFAADKPNILLIVSDDTGYGDLGPYGGGVGRGMPTPNIDKLAQEGMTFFSTSTPSQAARRAAPPCRRDAFPTAAV